VSTDVGIVDKIVLLHTALDTARLSHAFGGALALAWCTERARGTIDIDLNVFVDQTLAGKVFDALPLDVARSPTDLARCLRDGQVRLWWGRTPIDLFTNTTEFHVAAADRSVVHAFASHRVPFLCCSDVAVFKAFFNRTRDWADLEEMVAAGTLDRDLVLGALAHYVGRDDERVERLTELLSTDG
jgi:hypothetical protein